MSDVAIDQLIDRLESEHYYPHLTDLVVEPSVTDEYKPRVWQLEDLRDLVQKKGSANWNEMGVYKTTTALWLMQQVLRHKPNPRILVVTSKSGKGTYFKHVPALFPEWGMINVHSQGVKKVMFDFEVPLDDFPHTNDRPLIVVSHYNLFTKKSQIAPHLLAGMWDFVVLDEAHRIKSTKAQCTQQVHKIKAHYRHVMTGTGFINNPAEIYSLIRFIDKAQAMSEGGFSKYYCEMEYDWSSGYEKIVGIKPGRKKEFKEMVRSYGPRRTKSEVFRHLDKPIYSPIEVDLNPTQRKMYDEIETYLRTLDQAGVPIHSPNVLSMLNRLRQICVGTPQVLRDYFDEKEQRRKLEIQLIEPSSKLDAMMEVIEGLEWDEERKDQVVVFSCFKDPIEMAKVRLARNNIPYIHLEQKDNDRTRYEKWAIEFPKKEHQVFLSTLQLGSESISLTSATTCLFLDRSWSPKDNEQGIARLWRPGQKGTVNVIHLEARKTTDQKILDLNNLKQSWFNDIFGKDEDE